MERIFRIVFAFALLVVVGVMLTTPTAAEIPNNCKKFVGLWDWQSTINTEIQIKPDGTADALCGFCDRNIGWTCTGNVFELKSLGGGKLTLSPDGKKMTGNVGIANVGAVAIRKSAPLPSARPPELAPSAGAAARPEQPPVSIAPDGPARWAPTGPQ